MSSGYSGAQVGEGRRAAIPWVEALGAPETFVHLHDGTGADVDRKSRRGPKPRNTTGASVEAAIKEKAAEKNGALKLDEVFSGEDAFTAPLIGSSRATESVGNRDTSLRRSPPTGPHALTLAVPTLLFSELGERLVRWSAQGQLDGNLFAEASAYAELRGRTRALATSRGRWSRWSPRGFAPRLRWCNRAGPASVAPWRPFDYPPREAIEPWRGEPGT